MSLYDLYGPTRLPVFGKQKKDGFAAPPRKDPGRPKWRRRPFSHTEKNMLTKNKSGGKERTLAQKSFSFHFSMYFFSVLLLK